MPNKRLTAKVMDDIATGAINDQGVRGLADTLHISERHLRRIVHDRTGSSPLHIDTTQRLEAAKRLIAETVLPIIDIAFLAEFSSLRQFNAVFKDAYKTSPRSMRKTILSTPEKRPHRFVAIPLAHLVYMTIPKNSLQYASNNQIQR